MAVFVTGVEIVLYFVDADLLYSHWNQDDIPTTTTPFPANSGSDVTPRDAANVTQLYIYMAPSSGEVWISIAFFYLVLNLLAIGLVGHLLGFHIYLIR